MKKTLIILLVIIMTASIFAGCGISEKSVEYTNGDSSIEYRDDINDEESKMGNSAPAPGVVPEAMGNTTAYDDGGGVYEEGRKAIKTADIQIEVNNFADAFESIKSMLGTNGYIEESNIWKTPSYYNGEQIMLTNGTIRLRVKANSFQGFTDGLAGIGTVLSASTYEDDISDMYYDTEARLSLLNDEKARLEDYARDIEDPDIFFQTQSRITQVIYEMERLQGTLKKWDSKVEYSTVNITINEKHPEEESAVQKPKGFFEKIWDNMKDGVSFLGDVIIFFAGALPILLLLAAFAIIIIVIIKKVSKKPKSTDNTDSE